ncbi:MAG TPA: hypothetical protein VFZ59_16050 [Verrucomicrobiae bacterium]|nr:hypothetical protein [Verrucomicrobiae bacterium]
MTEQKTNCQKCGVQILQATSDRTGGLCMPCKVGGPRLPDPNDPVEISCVVLSDVTPHPTFFTSAQSLLKALEEVRHIGDSMHANKYELEAQRAILRHCVRYRTNFRLNDDHWGRTGYTLLKLFEEGQAAMKIGERIISFTELTKEEWREGVDPLASHGGFLYRDSAGTLIYKRNTWVS